ncbi:MAG: hypothetical protein QNJ45_17915 [Ardenticatenaceae bacterium]|nr:hypothetical protein [Ardenticatenaceae bacterium]
MNTLTHIDYAANPHGLAVGGGIYAVVSAVWLGIALALDLVSGLVLAITAVPAVALLASSIWVGLRTPVSHAYDQQATIGKWFGLIFAGEGILIGVGSGVLMALDQPDLILPWVAFIVGLHFFPLGYLLRLKLDYLLGAAIVLLSIVGSFTNLPTQQVMLTFGTALLLWLAGVGRLTFALNRADARLH